jgi:hypothetical protein
MRRAFGLEISGNRGRGVELSTNQRARILALVETKKLKGEIARQFRYYRRTIYNTIYRFNEASTIRSLP